MYLRIPLLALSTLVILPAYGSGSNQDNRSDISALSNTFDHQVTAEESQEITFISTYKIMTQSDWDVVFDGLGFEDTPETPNPEDNFTLAPNYLYSSFTLSYGDKNELMTGAIINTPTSSDEARPFAQIVSLNEDNEISQQCWNTELNSWINPDNSDSGYQPKAITVEGNEIKSYYSGTEVPIRIKVEKINTNSETWQAIINTTPSEYKLNEIEWPNTIYRYFSSQGGKVLCRDEDYMTHTMVAPSVESLSSANIAETLYPSFYPEDVTADEANQRFTVESFGTYEWALHEAPNQQPHLRITEIDPSVPENLAPYVLPSDYLVVDGEFIEVEVHDEWEYEFFNDHLFITFDGKSNDFNQKIKAHFEQFTAPYMP